MGLNRLNRGYLIQFKRYVDQLTGSSGDQSSFKCLGTAIPGHFAMVFLPRLSGYHSKTTQFSASNGQNLAGHFQDSIPRAGPRCLLLKPSSRDVPPA